MHPHQCNGNNKKLFLYLSIPLKYYKFLTFCWMDHTTYESNKAEFAESGKWFLRSLSRSSKCDSFYFWLSPDDSPSELYPIGPFAK